MKKHNRYLSLLPIYILVLTLFLLLAISGSRAVSVLSVNTPIKSTKIIVIDAGHGGVDGGATSCTDIPESQYNLEIAMKLNDLMHLLGINTRMIRETNCSVYREGETIAQKKVSDLKERVRIVNNTENAFLVSIHQNYFSQSKYNGAQVFFAPSEGSKEIALQLQNAFITYLNPGSKRSAKQANGIYLMQNIDRPGVLIECGFLSNPKEAYLLSTPQYQQKLCAVIACTVSNALSAP